MDFPFASVPLNTCKHLTSSFKHYSAEIAVSDNAAYCIIHNLNFF